MVRGLIAEILATLLYWLSLLINKTLRVKFINRGILDRIIEENKSFAFAAWHQVTFPLFYQCRDLRLCIMPLDSLAGEVLARFGRKYKFRAIQYKVHASSLENTRCLINILKAMKEGCNLALAVDGPPGELKMYKAKPGILFLSQKSNCDIVPVGVNFSAHIKVPFRWDKYIIPLPFSRVTIVLNPPFNVPKELKVHDVEKLTPMIEEKIKAAEAKAQELSK